MKCSAKSLVRERQGPPGDGKTQAAKKTAKGLPGRALLTVALEPETCSPPKAPQRIRCQEQRSDLRLFIRRLEDLRRPRYQASTATAGEQPT